MHCELVDHMGTDLTVVNAARVSFDKESGWDTKYVRNANPNLQAPDFDELVKVLSEKDIKLINYLATHNHWTPFSHVMITMRETVPIFVARQRFKHMVGFTYNEVSRRYVDDKPQFYCPDKWRGKPVNAKQGSSDEEIHTMLFSNNVETWRGEVGDFYQLAVESCMQTYECMIKAGVAPEQARMVLPQSMYTSYYVTGSLAAWARAYKLRSDTNSQLEIQELAKQWDEIISNIPELQHSWDALTKDK